MFPTPGFHRLYCRDAVHGVTLDPGLCRLCAHSQVVPSSRDATFWLCGLSFTDPRFLRYPPVPVIACTGYERRPDTPSPGAST